MKVYDLSNNLDKISFQSRVAQLLKSAEKRRVIVELGEKAERTLSQNSYLHLILSYFACETGLTLDYVKRNYFKYYCNHQLFVITTHDELLGKDIKSLRSSRDLSKEDMTLAIDRFIAWSEAEACIPLPRPEDKELLRECELAVAKAQKFL